jgi:Cof subfamily protein (haloacid dehalogenase superfamily)
VRQMADSTATRLPRLIVTDLDGTFLMPDGTVSDVNRRAVLAAQSAGIPVLFATGRPTRWLEVIQDLPGAHSTVIASNGAVLYDQSTSTVLDRICLDPHTTSWAVERIRRRVPGVAFALESGNRFGHEENYVVLRAAAANTGVYVASAEEMAAAGDHVKMLVQHAELSSDELLAKVRDSVGDALTLTHSAFVRPQVGERGLVEISAPGVSKATMLARCCEDVGVAASDVAGFGDMPNDLDMLSWVGMPHVVANAHPLLLESYPVVPANVDSGVGRTILGWLS